MALSLEIRSLGPGPKVDTLTPLVVELAVRNEGAGDLVFDFRSREPYLELRDEEGAPLQRFTAALRQRRLIHRTSREPLRAETLPAGEERSYRFELAEYGGSFAAGRYQLVPCCRDVDERVVEGSAVAVEVEPGALVQAECWFEDPIFGSENLLLVGADGVARSRWLGDRSPTGAHVDAALEGAPAQARAIPSVASFFDLEDFETGMIKAVVWAHEEPTENVTVCHTFEGALRGRPVEASLPQPLRLLERAYRDEDGTQVVFGVTPDEVLKALAIDPAGVVEEVFSRPLEQPGVVAAGWIPGLFYVVEAGPPLRCVVCDDTGAVLAEHVIDEAEEGQPLLLRLDLPGGTLRACYRLPAEEDEEPTADAADGGQETDASAPAPEEGGAETGGADADRAEPDKPDADKAEATAADTDKAEAPEQTAADADEAPAEGDPAASEDSDDAAQEEEETVPERLLFIQSGLPQGEADPPAIRRVRTLRVGADDELSEIAFTIDRMSRLHVLRAGSASGLVYSRRGGSAELEPAGGPFFPVLLPGDPENQLPFGGFFSPARGYRFHVLSERKDWQAARERIA